MTYKETLEKAKQNNTRLPKTTVAALFARRCEYGKYHI